MEAARRDLTRGTKGLRRVGVLKGRRAGGRRSSIITASSCGAQRLTSTQSPPSFPSQWKKRIRFVMLIPRACLFAARQVQCLVRYSAHRFNQSGGGVALWILISHFVIRRYATERKCWNVFVWPLEISIFPWGGGGWQLQGGMR